MKNLKNKKGFTLTELIVVIVIIGILAAVLIPTLTGYIKKANQSADQQELSSLNTLLLDAKINQTKFESVNQLKEYLEYEMDYDGDYSLRTNESYLWYDTKNYSFVIIGAEDNANLSAANDSYTVVSPENIKSPEGLLQYSDGSELWIVGGKGKLIDVVKEIREVANTGSNLSEFSTLNNEVLKEALKSLFANYKFVGSAGSFVIDEDGKVSEWDENCTQQKEIFSDYLSENVRLFHEQVIAVRIEEIKNELKGSPVSLELEDNYKVTITIEDVDNGLITTAAAVFKIIEILKSEGCLYGYIIPSQFKDYESYDKALNDILGAVEKDDSKVITENLRQHIIQNKDSLFKVEKPEDLYKVNLNDISTTNITDLIKMVKPILFSSLNIKFAEENSGYLYDCYEFSGSVSGSDIFYNKNDLRLIGAIKSAKYGNVQIEYVFHFDVNMNE